MRHEHESRSLGHGFAEGVVKDQAIHASLPRRDIVRAHSDLISLAIANPLDTAQADVVQLFHDGASLVLGHRASSLLSLTRGIVIAVGARWWFQCCRGRGGHARSESILCAGMLEDAEIDAFLVRLYAPAY